MANLSLTYSSLYNVVARYLHLRQPGKWYENIDTRPNDPQTTTIKDIVSRGYRQFLYPIDQRVGREHLWSFLKQHVTIHLQPNKWKYALPENFSEMLTDPSFSDEDGYYSLIKKNPEQLLEMRVSSVDCNIPSYYAITASNYSIETGTFYEMWVHGEPGAAYTIQFFYKIDPSKPSATGDYLVGGIRAVEAITENCLAVAEQQELGEIGVHNQLAITTTQALIATDSNIESNIVLGNMYSGVEENIHIRGENAYFRLEYLYPDEGNTFTEP